MITGIVKSKKTGPDSIEVFWTIRKLGKKLEEDEILQSVPFYFAGQMWRQMLTAVLVDILEALPIDFSISRITVSKDETPASPVVCWNMGIVDSDGRSHYGRTGFARLETDFMGWMAVANFSGPEFTHLCLQEELYMPGDKITIALRLSLDSPDALIKDEQDTTPKFPILKESSRNLNVVVFNVSDETFYAEDSILGAISEEVELQNHFREWAGGKSTVIDLPDCDPKAFEFFLSFAYSKDVEVITDDIAREVYRIAHELEVPKLKRECVLHFLSNLNVSSVCRVLELAEKHHDQTLKKKCSEFFLKNFREILNTSEWLEFMATQKKFANDLIISYLDSTV